MLRADRIHLLDGLRGVFALCVLAYHYVTWLQIPVPNALYGLLDRTAIYAVCGFFTLSGTSMAIAYKDRPPTSRMRTFQYLLQRFFRIAPLYYAVLAIHLGAKIASCFRGNACDASLSDLLLNITFLFGFGEAARHSMVVAGWSIGIEWVFYLVFPFMLYVASRSLEAALGMVALSVLALVWWDLLFLSDPVLTWTDYAQFPAYAAYFTIGVAIGLYRPPIKSGLRILCSTILAYVALHFVSPEFSPNHSVAGPAAWGFGVLTCLMVFSATSAEVPQWAHHLCRVAGEISYPVYLLHFPVYMAVSLLPLGVEATFGLAVVLVLTLGYLSWHVYEHPFVRLGRRLSEAAGKKAIASS